MLCPVIRLKKPGSNYNGLVTLYNQDTMRRTWADFPSCCVVVACNTAVFLRSPALQAKKSAACAVEDF